MKSETFRAYVEPRHGGAELDFPSSIEMRVRDTLTIESGVPAFSLMERAAIGLKRVLLKKFSQELRRGWVCIFCGPGNNGGDGLLLGALLADSGCRVQLFVHHGRTSSPERCLALQRAENSRALLVCGQGDGRFAWLRRRGAVSLIVDALLGTGQSQELREPLAEMCSCVQKLVGFHCAPLVHVDVPTGSCADTGRFFAHGLRGGHLVAIDSIKRGLLQPPALLSLKSVEVVDIGLLRKPEAVFRLASAHLYPRGVREGAQHKGVSGRVLVIGGSRGMEGAPFLCARSAVATGAGVVKVVFAGKLFFALPEVMSTCLDDCFLREIHFGDIRDAVQSSDSIVIGPGLGSEPESLALVRMVLQEFSGPVVIDANALEVFHDEQEQFESNALRVLTPHPGEAARILSTNVAVVQNDRYAAAARIQEKTGAVVVLKGISTIIASATEGYVYPGSNAALATAGSGDVLAGIIAAFLATWGKTSGDTMVGGLNDTRWAVQSAAAAVSRHSRIAAALSEAGGVYPSARDIAEARVAV